MNDSAKQFPIVNVSGVNISLLTVEELHTYIDSVIQAGQRRRFFDVNAYGINLANADPHYQALLNQADMVFADGFGIRAASYLLGKPAPPRITMADWLWQVSEFSSSKGYSLFLLGAKPGVAERAAHKLQARFPSLKIAGTQHGYFSKLPQDPANLEAIERINAARPNIMMVCFGMPLQETWVDENWERLNCNIAVTGGAVLDYISGDLQRGPRILTENGFEWLARLVIEPRRLWKRYILGNPQFIAAVVKQRITGNPPQPSNQHTIARG